MKICSTGQEGCFFYIFCDEDKDFTKIFKERTEYPSEKYRIYCEPNKSESAINDCINSMKNSVDDVDIYQGLCQKLQRVMNKTTDPKKDLLIETALLRVLIDFKSLGEDYERLRKLLENLKGE